MYICNYHDVCDPICDFCWYCMFTEYGRPVQCEKGKNTFDDGMGYCDDFRCRLHEPKPHDKKIEK